jgi:hypothetical protein
LTLGPPIGIVACQAAEILFSSTTGGGDITTGSLGATAPLVPSFPPNPIGLSETFDKLVVTGAPSNNGTYSPLFLTETFNTTTDVLTLVGAIPGLSILSQTLVTIQLNTDLTANATTTSVSLNKPSAASIVSITLSPTLLADLGLPSATFSLNGLTDLAASCCDTGLNYQNQTSASLDLVTGVPEPTSWLLTGIGLASLAFVSKKFSRA